jgi:hypothetical protein
MAGSAFTSCTARSDDAELYPSAAALTAAGIRQAAPRLTETGSAIGATGYTVQEFQPGQTRLHPSPAQVRSTMRHVAAHHAPKNGASAGRAARRAHRMGWPVVHRARAEGLACHACTGGAAQAGHAAGGRPRNRDGRRSGRDEGPLPCRPLGHPGVARAGRPCPGPGGPAASDALISASVSAQSSAWTPYPGTGSRCGPKK